MRAALLFLCLGLPVCRGESLSVRNAAGVVITVDAEDRGPALTLRVPDGPGEERAAKILVPEHVTVRAHGAEEATHLYVFRPGQAGETVEWTKAENALQYRREFAGVEVLARATLTEDGVVFRYEFVNHSTTDFDMATAVTDPRFHTMFYDPRLLRTYVHEGSGFVLLASETPDRIRMPLEHWFPVRYLASYTAGVPEQRMQRRDDGITYYYRSRRIDIPLIATMSEDGKWVAASFARNPGNVWTNPELTCQHVDPEVRLERRARAALEVKMLVLKGSLEDALRKVREQRSGLE